MWFVRSCRYRALLWSGAAPGVAEAKGLKPSKEGGKDPVFMEAVTWGAGGCKNILPNFSFCF